MWLHTNGDIRKVAACKVRPYELVDTKNLTDSQDSAKKKVVMLEHGLSDNKTQDDEVFYDAVDTIDEEKDCIGAKSYVFFGLCYLYSRIASIKAWNT